MKHEYCLSCHGQIAKGLERGEVKFGLIDELKLTETKADKLLSGDLVTLQRSNEREKIEQTQQKLQQLGLLTQITFSPDANILKPFMRDTLGLEDGLLRRVYQAELNFQHTDFKRWLFNSRAEYQLSAVKSAQTLIRKTAGFSEPAAALLAMAVSFFIMQHGLKTQLFTSMPQGLASGLGILFLFGGMLGLNALLTANQVYRIQLPTRLWCRSLLFKSPLQQFYRVYDDRGEVLGQICHWRGAKIWCFCDESGVELYRCEYEWGTDEKAGSLATEMRDDLMDFDYFDHLASKGKRLLGLFGLKIDNDTDSHAAWVTRDMNGELLGKWTLEDGSVNITAGCHSQSELTIVLFMQTLMAGKLA